MIVYTIITQGLNWPALCYSFVKWMGLFRVQIQLITNKENTNEIIHKMNKSRKHQFIFAIGLALGIISNFITYLVLPHY